MRFSSVSSSPTACEAAAEYQVRRHAEGRKQNCSLASRMRLSRSPVTRRSKCRGPIPAPGNVENRRATSGGAKLFQRDGRACLRGVLRLQTLIIAHIAVCIWSALPETET